MNIIVREYSDNDLKEMIDIWNDVVIAGDAFPQTECLNETTGREFFESQTYNGVAVDTDTGSVLGLYILHPNNIGRCGHISNASYAVRKDMRGKRIGEALVKNCIEEGRGHGFKILQFNAVVKTNYAARKLYEKLGFIQLGTIPGGFLMKSGNYVDICPYYLEL